MELEKPTCLAKFAKLVTAHLHGVRSGKKFGMKLNIVAINAGVEKIKQAPLHKYQASYGQVHRSLNHNPTQI